MAPAGIPPKYATGNASQRCGADGIQSCRGFSGIFVQFFLFRPTVLYCEYLQGVALTGRNRTGPPCTLSAVQQPPTRQAAGRPARQRAALQTTTDDRRQRAKRYWPITRASNNITNNIADICVGPII